MTVRGYLTTQTEYGLRCGLIVGCYERQEKVGRTIAHVSIVYILIICHKIVAPGNKFKQKLSFEKTDLAKQRTEKKLKSHMKSLWYPEPKKGCVLSDFPLPAPQTSK